MAESDNQSINYSDLVAEKGIIEGTLPGNRKKRKTENSVDRQCHFMDGTEARRYNPESGQQICTTIHSAAYPWTAKGK